MPVWTGLGEGEELEELRVAAWHNNHGIFIDSPKVREVLSLTNVEAMRLLAWLNKRYVLDVMADL